MLSSKLINRGHLTRRAFFDVIRMAGLTAKTFARGHTMCGSRAIGIPFGVNPEEDTTTPGLHSQPYCVNDNFHVTCNTVIGPDGKEVSLSFGEHLDCDGVTCLHYRQDDKPALLHLLDHFVEEIPRVCAEEPKRVVPSVAKAPFVVTTGNPENWNYMDWADHLQAQGG